MTISLFFVQRSHLVFPIDLLADKAVILISIVSNSYYGMPRGQMHINLPPEHTIMSFETIEIKMAAVSAKRSMHTKPFKISFHWRGQNRDNRQTATAQYPRVRIWY